MNYADTLAALYRRTGEFHIKLGLKNMRRLLARLGNPQKQFPAVHIAGTNGKGSVAAMTASVLQAAGYRTGLYTSPHLIDYRERIRVGRRLISRREVLNGLRRIESAIRAERQRRPDFDPTFFEITTALAFDHFARRGVDIAVAETGLGGRLDATNLCLPIVTAITHIDWDHQQYLGGTLLKIAREKAGIIKRGVPLVTAERKREILNFFKKEARRKKVPIAVVTRRRAVPSVETALEGSFQRENAAVALKILELLGSRGFPVSQKGLRRGFGAVRWPGRFQTVGKSPRFILDGSHNREGIKTFLAELRKKKIHKPAFIFGMMKDKDVRAAARAIGRAAGIIYCVEAGGTRGMPAGELAQLFGKSGGRRRAVAVGNMGNALTRARKDGNRVICVCGSLYIVGEALKALKKKGT